MEFRSVTLRSYGTFVPYAGMWYVREILVTLNAHLQVRSFMRLLLTSTTSYYACFSVSLLSEAALTHNMYLWSFLPHINLAIISTSFSLLLYSPAFYLLSVLV
jgi:hypothetical protein